jgi:geranylgeranyl pyrophosphate synthase
MELGWHLRQGLITLPTIYYRETNPVDPNLDLILCGKNIDIENLNQLVDAIQSSGAIERSMDKAKQFVDQALDALNELPLTAERQALEDLSNYIIDRHL